MLCASTCIYSFIFPAGDRFSNFTRLDWCDLTWCMVANLDICLYVDRSSALTSESSASMSRAVS